MTCRLKPGKIENRFLIIIDRAIQSLNTSPSGGVDTDKQNSSAKLAFFAPVLGYLTVIH